jgi:phospho-N-acetylmuramoyl-pentapeptide-transferase
MSKKSPVIGAILGFFILGLFYSTGFNKKGIIAVIALVFVQWGVGLASPELAIIVSIAGAYLGYRWSNEHNAMLEEGMPAQ